jgi:prolyl-tRNA synthetase
MVIKPWGYGIWELLQRELDNRIKASGVENAYFPLFIPLKFLRKRSSTRRWFCKRMRSSHSSSLSNLKMASLVPTGELEEPLIVRPTSETIIGDSFSKWVKSYRDLPLRINQWANVVRWEMRPRLFLRTAEFLWQEGHTVHASKEDAMWQVEDALRIYKEVIEDILAIPVVIGEKSAWREISWSMLTPTRLKR